MRLRGPEEPGRDGHDDAVGDDAPGPQAERQPLVPRSRQHVADLGHHHGDNDYSQQNIQYFILFYSSAPEPCGMSSTAHEQ